MKADDGERYTYVSLSSLPRFWNPATGQLDSVRKDKHRWVTSDEKAMVRESENW